MRVVLSEPLKPHVPLAGMVLFPTDAPCPACLYEHVVNITRVFRLCDDAVESVCCRWAVGVGVSVVITDDDDNLVLCPLDCPPVSGVGGCAAKEPVWIAVQGDALKPCLRECGFGFVSEG